MNLIRRARVFLVALILCFCGCIYLNSGDIYAAEILESQFTFNYSDLVMFPGQDIKLEVSSENFKGEKVTLDEFNRRQEEGWDKGDYYYFEISYLTDNSLIFASEDGVVHADPIITETTYAAIGATYTFMSNTNPTPFAGGLDLLVTVDMGEMVGAEVVATEMSSYYVLATDYTRGTVKWSVDNPEIATVDEAGLLTGKSYGTVKLYAEIVDGDDSYFVLKTVRISDPKFAKDVEALAVGGSFTLELTGIYSDSSKLFASSKSKYVNVSEEGLVYALKYSSSEIVITAFVDGKQISMKIKITNPKINKGDRKPILLVKGKKCTLKVKGLAPKLSYVKYSSDRSKIATVSKKGKVKGRKYGSCYIEVEVDHKVFKINCGVGKAKAIKAVKAAYRVYGCPYSQPKRMSKGFYDCSSLAWRTYKSAGFYVGNTGMNYASVAADECKFLFGRGGKVARKACSYKKLRPGDLVFYSGWKNGRYKNITHVAIYVANNTLIEANWPNGVKEAPYIAKGKSKYIVGIGRPIK